MKTQVNVFLILLFSTLAFVSQAQDLPLVQVEGNSFVLPNGDPIVFNGLNASDPDKLEKDGHWNLEYFEAIKSWGANIVRFPIHPRAWRARGEKAYFELLDQGVEMARQNGLYVIFDWHSIGNLRSELFFKDMYNTSKKETFEFWRSMAQRYGKNSTVAFFELFNEPTVMNNALGLCSWEDWKLLMEEIIIIIRANGAQNIPLVAGFNWGYDLRPVAEQPINAEGIAYVSHPYPQKREKPWAEKWEADWGFIAQKYPLVLTEIGFCGADEPGAHIPVISDESYGESLTQYCEERGISYTVWVFDPQWSPMLIKNWDFEPTRQGRFWKNYLQGRR